MLVSRVFLIIDNHSIVSPYVYFIRRPSWSQLQLDAFTSCTWLCIHPWQLKVTLQNCMHHDHVHAHNIIVANRQCRTSISHAITESVCSTCTRLLSPQICGIICSAYIHVCMDVYICMHVCMYVHVCVWLDLTVFVVLSCHCPSF